MDRLIEAARGVRGRAYAPYSGYRVGAAVLGADGGIYVGCNVENVSYGATLCAERAAVLRMVADGCQEIRGVAVATQDGGTPCGACLQVLAEFVRDPATVRVFLADNDSLRADYALLELLPHGFTSKGVSRTERVAE